MNQELRKELVALLDLKMGQLPPSCRLYFVEEVLKKKENGKRDEVEEL